MPLQKIKLDGSENGATSAAKINTAFDEIEKKEFKVPGKGLSTEDFTTALKDKLANHEGSHFKGVHPTLTLLRIQHPSPEDGSYAFLTHGTGPVTIAAWDKDKTSWEDMGASGSAGGVPLTGAQIKALYEGEADTNAFTDSAKSELAALVAGGNPGSSAMKFNVATVADIPNVPYTEGDMGQIRNYNGTGKEAIALYNDNSNWVFFEQDRLASLGLAIVGNNLISDQDIELKNDQILSQDPNVVAKDKRLITVKNAFAIEVGLKNWIEQQGYGSSAGGLFQFDYKVKVSAADPTPAVKFISFDDTTFANTTKIYINKKDRNNTDMTLFLTDVKKGDYFNIHDNNNVGQFVAFDVIGDSVQNGDVFEIPVSFYDDNGILTNGERVYIHWKQDVDESDIMAVKDNALADMKDIKETGIYYGTDVIDSIIKGPVMIMASKDVAGNLGFFLMGSNQILHTGGKAFGGTTIKWNAFLSTQGIITDIHDIQEMGIYEGTDVANAPVTGHIIVEAFEDSNGDLDLTLKDQTGRRTEGGMPAGGTATWHHVAADHLFGAADPLDTLGHDGDLYFKTA